MIKEVYVYRLERPILLDKIKERFVEKVVYDLSVTHC